MATDPDGARMFPTAVVLSAIGDVLLCDIGEVYDLLSFLVGRPVFTHEIPSAGKLCRPHVEQQHPTLAGYDATGINRNNWSVRLAELVANYGGAFALTPIGWNDLAERHPLETLQDMVGDKPIIVVEAPDGD